MLPPNRPFRIFLVTILLTGAVACLAAGVPVVVATHAVLGEMVSIVGGDEIEVVTLIPSGFCPAHYDLAPSDLAAVARAQLVIYSGFEPWMDTLRMAIGSEASILQLAGEWNTPATASAKLTRITDQLRLVSPSEGASFSSRAAAYDSELTLMGTELTHQASSLKVEEIAVICIVWQAEFIEWLGFDIAATYNSPETLSLRDLVELANIGTEAGVALVIDNLQSGIQFGAKLAQEIGAVHVVLSNFPGAMPNTGTFLDLLRANADALFAAISPLQ